MVRCKMQTALSRIWTQIAHSISYYINRYTTRPHESFINLSEFNSDSLFNGISIFLDYLISKPSLLKDSNGAI